MERAFQVMLAGLVGLAYLISLLNLRTSKLGVAIKAVEVGFEATVSVAGSLVVEENHLHFQTKQ